MRIETQGTLSRVAPFTVAQAFENSRERAVHFRRERELRNCNTVREELGAGGGGVFSHLNQAAAGTMPAPSPKRTATRAIVCNVATPFLLVANLPSDVTHAAVAKAFRQEVIGKESGEELEKLQKPACAFIYVYDRCENKKQNDSKESEPHLCAFCLNVHCCPMLCPPSWLPSPSRCL